MDHELAVNELVVIDGDTTNEVGVGDIKLRLILHANQPFRSD